jgi:hypothetical protein
VKGDDSAGEGGEVVNDQLNGAETRGLKMTRGDGADEEVVGEEEGTRAFKPTPTTVISQLSTIGDECREGRRGRGGGGGGRGGHLDEGLVVGYRLCVGRVTAAVGGKK